MKLTVILPVYQGEKTLAITLDSLLNQTFTGFELILGIDGGNDRSLEIAESYRNRFSQFTLIINQLNLGLGANLNRLIFQAKGEYIAMAEQDDFYYPDRLQQQVDFLDKNATAGMVSGIADFFDGKKITTRFPGMLEQGEQYPLKKEMFLLNYRNQIKVVNSAMMFRKSVHQDHGLYFSKHYPGVSTDWAYVLRFSLVADIHGLDKSLVLMNRERDRKSLTSNKTIQYLAARELLRSFYFEYPHLITPADYKYAFTTQYMMELGSCKLFLFPYYFTKYFLQNPLDKRWIPFLQKKFLRFRSQ